MPTQTADKLDYYKTTQSKNGNFKVIDSIGVPHPYCITPKHIAYAADHHYGMLNADSIRESEENGARCDICKGKLSYDEHKQALLISCKTEIKDNKELKEYLLSLKDKVIQDNYAGFAFKKEF